MWCRVPESTAQLLRINFLSHIKSVMTNNPIIIVYLELCVSRICEISSNIENRLQIVTFT